MFLVLSSIAVASQSGPALKIVELAFPTRYNAIEQNITYFYMVTNSGNVSLAGNINITDNVTGTTTLSTDGLDEGSILTGISIHTITQADIDAGSVTNLASAIGSFNNQPVISPNTSATVIYEHPTNSFRPINGGGLNNSGYGGAFEPWDMYDSPIYNNEPYLYGGDLSRTAEILNSDSWGSKAKLSSSKAHVHLSKHKHKNHPKHHKAGKKSQM